MAFDTTGSKSLRGFAISFGVHGQAGSWQVGLRLEASRSDFVLAIDASEPPFKASSLRGGPQSQWAQLGAARLSSHKLNERLGCDSSTFPAHFQLLVRPGSRPMWPHGGLQAEAANGMATSRRRRPHRTTTFERPSSQAFGSGAARPVAPRAGFFANVGTPMDPEAPRVRIGGLSQLNLPCQQTRGLAALLSVHTETLALSQRANVPLHHPWKHPSHGTLLPNGRGVQRIVLVKIQSGFTQCVAARNFQERRSTAFQGPAGPGGKSPRPARPGGSATLCARRWGHGAPLRRPPGCMLNLGPYRLSTA